MPGSINGSPWMLTLANRAPNPNAAQLFANWILSKEGLGIYARGYGSVSMRTDIDGRIFAARPDKGTVVVLSPDGTVVREVPVRGKGPTNLSFGGPDGKTVFVTQSKGGFIEAFRVDRPGREHCMQAPAGSC